MSSCILGGAATVAGATGIGIDEGGRGMGGGTTKGGIMMPLHCLLLLSPSPPPPPPPWYCGDVEAISWWWSCRGFLLQGSMDKHLDKDGTKPAVEVLVVLAVAAPATASATIKYRRNKHWP